MDFRRVFVKREGRFVEPPKPAQLSLFSQESLSLPVLERLAALTPYLSDSRASSAPSSIAEDTYFLTLLRTYKERVRLQKAQRITQVTTLLHDQFREQGIELFPLVDHDHPAGSEQSCPLDLFVRFPESRNFFALSFRAFGESRILFNESKQTLYYKRGPKGTNQWKPDPIAEISDQLYWLRKRRKDLFISSRGLRRPCPKCIVVMPPTKVQHPHSDHLYQPIGAKKFVLVGYEEKGFCYLFDSKELVDFMQSWLSEQAKG